MNVHALRSMFTDIVRSAVNKMEVLKSLLWMPLLALYLVDGCEDSPAADLEVVFLIDQSSINVLARMKQVIKIIDSIAETYKDPKFGVSGFSDYACKVWNDQTICKKTSHEPPVNGVVPKYHNHPQGCYIFQESLTSNRNLIKERINKLEFLPSGYTESGLAGVYLTAAEPKIKWTRGTSQTLKQKLLFVVTDDRTHVGRNTNHLNHEKKKPLKGDGTDDCNEMQNPNTAEVGNLLRKNGMHIFLLYANSVTYSSWSTELKNSGLKFKIAELNRTNNEIFSAFNDFVLEVSDNEMYKCVEPMGYNSLGL